MKSATFECCISLVFIEFDSTGLLFIPESRESCQFEIYDNGVRLIDASIIRYFDFMPSLSFNCNMPTMWNVQPLCQFGAVVLIVQTIFC